MKRFFTLSIALFLLASCAAPQPPPGGYSKEEQSAMRQEARERRSALRAAGVASLQIAAGVLSNSEGFRK